MVNIPVYTKRKHCYLSMALRTTEYGCRGGAYDWAELPCDIIVSIFEHLDEYLVDIRRAASVCVAWHRAGSFLNSKEPSIINIPNCVCRDLKCNDSELRPNLLYFFISPAASNRPKTRAWLIRVEENGTNKWLLHPRSYLEYNFNLLDEHKILGVATLHILDIGNKSYIRIRKVISVSDLGMFLILFGNRKLGFWSKDSQWSYIKTRNYRFEDIIYLQNEFYAIDTIGKLVIINPTTLDVVEVASPPKGIEYDVKTMFLYLVCSDGYLYLVHTNFYRSHLSTEPNDVGVLMFDKQSRGWVRVENLGNKVFFITEYCTFSVTAKQLGWSRGSLICFMCDDFVKAHIFKVEGNVCREEKDLQSEIKVDFGRPPKWIRRMLLPSSEKRKSRKSKRNSASII
ncbi:putative F-box/kelch-repeat protein At5g24040 [Silene latifolia]|uniref:putative F-box/kelch-repeat protein At5g24040 n=1 Tax=Silene latifolia TaxID=37657 RepID=UPI003D7795A9